MYCIFLLVCQFYVETFFIWLTPDDFTLNYKVISTIIHKHWLFSHHNCNNQLNTFFIIISTVGQETGQDTTEVPNCTNIYFTHCTTPEWNVQYSTYESITLHTHSAIMGYLLVYILCLFFLLLLFCLDKDYLFRIWRCLVTFLIYD